MYAYVRFLILCLFYYDTIATNMLSATGQVSETYEEQKLASFVLLPFHHSFPNFSIRFIPFSVMEVFRVCQWLHHMAINKKCQAEERSLKLIIMKTPFR